MKKEIHIKYYLLFLFCLLSGTAAIAQDGTLDPSFNGNGFRIFLDSGSLSNRGNSIAKQSDGKLVTCGFSSFKNSNGYFTTVTRYNTNGTLDSSFGYKGTVRTQVDSVGSEGIVVKIQQDNKILVYANAYKYNNAGNPLSTVLIRYLPNGHLDSTFGKNGISQRIDVNKFASASKMLILPDQKIMVAATDNSDAFIARFKANGTLDSSFNKVGIYKYNMSFNFTSVAGMLQDPNGKLIVIGSGSNGGNMFYYIRRFNSNGTPDSSYSDDGVTNKLEGDVRGTRVVAIGYQDNGKIILAGDQGYSTRRLIIIRYNSDLSFDNTFDTSSSKVQVNGQLSSCKNAIVLADNSIAIVAAIGTNRDKLAVVHFNANGGFDQNFGTNGYFKGPEIFGAAGIVDQADGKLAFVCGEYDSTNSRYVQSVYRLRKTTLVGIQDVKSNTAAYLYPNPTSRNFHIAARSAIETIRVYDMTGKEISFALAAKDNEADISGYPAGIYTVEVLLEDKSRVCLRLLVQ